VNGVVTVSALAFEDTESCVDVFLESPAGVFLRAKQDAETRISAGWGDLWE
jgi:hypothetical protein